MKIITIILLLFSSSIFGQTKYQKDFNDFWTSFNENYAYFEKQNIDWTRVKEVYEPQVRSVQTDAAFVMLLEQVVNELHNGHISLNVNLHTSNRIIPSGSDLFIEKIENKYIIKDLRKGFAAELSGLKIGMEVVKFNGEPIMLQLSKFLPRYTNNYNERMYDYALSMLFAGTHDKPREITVIQDGAEKIYYPDSKGNQSSKKLVEFEFLKGNVGYIKINNSLANNDLIKEFDVILDKLINTKSLILDLSETPGGGNTTVARAIMGRFISRDMPYQKHELDEKEYGTKRSWVEYVSPRKTPYKNKLFVMVGHWTGSMGEGIAIGFDGMKRAKIAGTKMAGLIGAINGFSTTEMKIGFQFPVERLYHINGTPREDFIPRIFTDNIYETWDTVKKKAGSK